MRDYLERIRYDGPLDPSPGSLRALHYAHLLAVPFENLDIPRGVPIVLNKRRLLEKVVARRRGGFCYELNTTFSLLLDSLGFQVEKLSAGVHSAAGYGPEFDHMALLVRLDEPWLVDVGFGEGFLYPLRLRETLPQWQEDVAYKIEHRGRFHSLWRRKPDAEWTPLYRFTLRVRRLWEYAGMCRFHQTSPDSPFTRGRLCSRASADGRITLTDRRLILTTRAERREREIASEAEFQSLLDLHFGLHLNAG